MFDDVLITLLYFLQETEDDGALKPFKKDLDYLDDHLAVGGHYCI